MISSETKASSATFNKQMKDLFAFMEEEEAEDFQQDLKPILQEEAKVIAETQLPPTDKDKQPKVTTSHAVKRKDYETKFSKDLPECLKHLWVTDVKLLKKYFNANFMEEATLLS